MKFYNLFIKFWSSICDFPNFSPLGDEKAAEELIRNGADINALDAYGRSPLYVSILHGNFRNSLFL